MLSHLVEYFTKMNLASLCFLHLGLLPRARVAPSLSTVPGAIIKPGEEKNSLTMTYHEENRRRAAFTLLLHPTK